MDACDSSVPLTLLGFLLQGGDGSGRLPPSASSSYCDAGPGGAGFFRDYVSRGVNTLLWISLISVTGLLLQRLARLVRLWKQGTRLPGPPCPSFFGHSKLVGRCGSGGDLTGYLSKLHEKYGPIVRLWLGPTQLVVSVTDTKLIKEVLVKAEDRIPLTARAFRLAFGRSSLFNSSYEEVQKRRESLEAHMNGKLLERASALSSKVVDYVVSRLDTKMVDDVVDCRSIAQDMAFYILGGTLFGDNFLGWSGAAVYEEQLLMIARDACFWASYNIYPFWRKGFWRYQILCRRFKHLTQDIIRLCKSNYKLGVSPQSGNHVKNTRAEARMDATSEDMISSSFAWGDMEGNLSKDEPCGNIMGVMFHGCLNTASLVGSILTRLVLCPKLQEEIHSEIVTVSKQSSREDHHDVEKMHFLLAVIYESARLLPAGPLLQRCSLIHELCLNSNITVPAGAIMVVPLQLVQMDNTIWGNDAPKFNPSRFLPEALYHGGTSEGCKDSAEFSTMLTEPNENGAFLPFGSGTRACVGQKFAILGIARLFASLLEKYEVRLQPSYENDPNVRVEDCIAQHLLSPKIVMARRDK